MAGLLSDITDDPQSMGLLSLGLRLMSTPGRLGPALGTSGLGALQDIQQAKLAQQNKKQQDMRLQLEQVQLQQAQAQAQQQAAMRALAQQYARTPQQNAMQANGGPTNAAAAAIPTSQPSFDFNGYAQGLAGIDPMASLGVQQALKKDDAPIMVPEGGSLFTKTGKPLAMGTPKNDKPSEIKEYEFARAQGYPGTFEQWDTARKRAGATNVSVSMDKGFGDAFAKDAAGSLASSRDAAKAAANNINTLDRIDAAVSSGKVALGPTAKFETFGRQLGERIGVGGKDNAETLANTRKLLQGAASLAADGAKLLAGQGQISNGERDLIMRAAGGDIDSMTAPEIQALSGTLRKLSAVKIQQHDAALKKVGPQFAPFVPFYKVDMPEAPKPSVVDFGSLK